MMQIITLITQWKDTIQQSIAAIVSSRVTVPFDYTVYCGSLEDANKKKLENLSVKYHFNLININDLETNANLPEKNVLHHARLSIMSENIPLIVVSPDVIVEKDTIQQLYEYQKLLTQSGLISAVLTNNNGNIDLPHLFARKYKRGINPVRKGVGFYCVLFSSDLLKKMDFLDMPAIKDRYDVWINRRARQMGFKNYLLTLCPVVNINASSLLSWFSRPLSYFWMRLTGQI